MAGVERGHDLVERRLGDVAVGEAHDLDLVELTDVAQVGREVVVTRSAGSPSASSVERASCTISR